MLIILDEFNINLISNLVLGQDEIQTMETKSHHLAYAIKIKSIQLHDCIVMTLP